jgi:hypothetical protein
VDGYGKLNEKNNYEFFFKSFKKIPLLKTWNDYNLKWEPQDYGNISSIRVLSTKIWIPGNFSYN